MWRSKTTTPAARMTTNWAMPTATRGIALPSTISSEVAWLARSRSQVPHQCSAKNPKVTRDTTKNALERRLSGHDLLRSVGVGMTGLHQRRSKGRLEKCHRDEREHDEHHQRHRVAASQSHLVSEENTETAD